MIRVLPPKWTAGFARLSVSSRSRLPRPPASTRPVISSLAIMLMRATLQAAGRSSADVVHFDALLPAAFFGLHGASQLGITVLAPLPDVRDCPADLLIVEAAS